MEETLRYVQPWSLADLPPGRDEMSRRRFVRAHLLGGDQKIEVDGEMLQRRRQQLVIDRPLRGFIQ